jgi:hypothetical protein
VTISIEGWLDWTERIDGIPDKVYTAPNKGLGICCHSIEGSIEGALERFLNTDRVPGRPDWYTDYAAASCMFLNPRAGPLIQMYPVTASTWTSGSRSANTTLWAIESEGRAGEPLNANQVDNMMRLAGEWEAHTGKVASRANLLGIRNIWEHNEVSDTPTACPSGRYAPFYAALAERDDGEELTPEQKEFLDWAPARLSALEHALTGLTGTDAIEVFGGLNALGASPLVKRVENLERNGDTVARSNITGHIINHNNQGGAVPDHKHIQGGVVR